MAKSGRVFDLVEHGADKETHSFGALYALTEQRVYAL
jgi:hypothetical protein